ncbi:DNA helicase INO80 [Silurus meridionalis]|nr:DNA helicase INO80 [Silurus meridionalis]
MLDSSSKLYCSYEVVSESGISLLHPPHLPDLSPADFALFPKMKIQLKGRSFDTIAEIRRDIRRESQKVLATLQKGDFQDKFWKWQKLAQCMREVRRAAIQVQKNCKEMLPRARRLTKEMLLYWKYEKVEKEHRKRAEKEALEQRKLDEEMREAKRQQRKLNFLIMQTEVYAHFMGGKHKGVEGDGTQDEILRKLDESVAERQINIGRGIMVNLGHEDYDSEYYKSQALRNAKEHHSRKALSSASLPLRRGGWRSVDP